MTLFQWVSIPLLFLIVLLDVRGLLARRGKPFIRIGRMGMCILAALLIWLPGVTSTIATAAGIGRGTDLLLYLMLLVMPLAWFRIQTDKFLFERRLVALAREEALRTPVRGQE